MRFLFNQDKVFSFLYVILTGLLVFLFYGAKLPSAGFTRHPEKTLRDYIEDRLFDIRTQLKPDIEDVSKIALIAIDHSTIEVAEGPTAKDLSYSSLEKIVSAVLDSKAKKVAILLYPNIFSYEDPGLEGLAKLAANDPRLVIGTLGIETEYPSPRDLPEPLTKVRDQVFGLETFRERRQDIIRAMPYVGFRGRQLVNLFNSELGNQPLQDHTPFARYLLNYVNPARFQIRNATDFLGGNTPEKNREYLADKTVLIGYTTFRERQISHDQIFAKTPWQSESVDAEDGVPLLYIQANAINNLAEARALRPLGVWLNVIQTVVLAVLSALVWFGGIGLGMILLVGWWITFFYFHGLMMAFGGVFLPLSDTVIFAAFFTIAGALWQLKNITKKRLEEEGKAEAQMEVERIQSRFLDRFANELEILNDQVLTLLQKYKNFAFKQPITGDIYLKLLQSSEEFKDYLSGTKQFAKLGVNKHKKIHKTKVRIKPLLLRLLSQFDSSREVAKLKVDLQCDDDLVVFIDEKILEPIVFNLISNAIKYSPKSGTILIKAVAKDEGGRPSITVVDHGPGIDPAFHASIFEKFYRVQNDSVHKIKGNGLGLYLCRYFADQLGAELKLRSALGAGSTFVLRI